MSRITLVPTFRAGQTPHRLPLSSRDNLAIYHGYFPNSDTADTASDDSYPGSECGRWRNGRLADDCLSAGTEYCQLDCPFARKRALSEALEEHQGFYDADGVKPADASDHVGLFLALVTLGNLIWLAAIAIGVGYLLAGGWR